VNNIEIYFIMVVRGWPETGFLQESSIGREDIGKNPVAEIVGGWPETGFLREYLIGGKDIGKNPVS
jgi:hypothetical protein